MVGGGFFVVRGVVTGLLVVACVEDVLAVVVSFGVAGKVGDAVRERRIGSVPDSYYLLVCHGSKIWLPSRSGEFMFFNL